MNKYADIIKKHYEGYDEDIRFSKSKGTRLEYITNMHYIEKFAGNGARILEIGAATGNYSIELAKKGFDVTAVELVQHNLDILLKKANGIKNLTAVQGDALDLSRFEDGAFDMVLCFGPLYHLFTAADKMQAIGEAIRVCRKGGVIMFAYLTHSSIVWHYGVKSQHFDKLAPILSKDGRVADIPEEVFTGYHIEDFENQFRYTSTKHIANVSSDGIAYGVCREMVDVLSDEQYKLFVNWHLGTCERRDHQGLSGHMLYICQKI